MTTELVEAIRGALGYLEQEGVEIPLDIRLKAFQYGAIKAESGDLSAVNAYYHDEITQALTTFFEGGSVTAPRNEVRRAVADAFLDAFELGYTGAGGELPMEEDQLSWLDARINTEWGFVAQLFEQARQLKKDEEIDSFAWITEKADGYTRTLQSIFNQGALYSKKDRMLTFVGHDGRADNICQSINGTCVQLKGKRHKASWWISHDLVPYRGNTNYDCGAWECRHYLVDDQGERFTL